MKHGLSEQIESFRPFRRAAMEAEREILPYGELNVLHQQLEAIRLLARADQQQYGETGAYAVATMYHALYVDQARDHLNDLREWLEERAELAPPLSPTQAAYQMHSALRETVLALHYARHWAMLSASYHSSRAAADTFAQITSAIQLAEMLGERAGRVFMQSARAPLNELA